MNQNTKIERITAKVKSKKKWIWISIGLIVVCVIIYAIATGGKKDVTGTSVVTRGDVVEEVSVTGKVTPAKNIDLIFEKTGRIANIYVKVGEKVNSGDALIKLENSDLYAQVVQAEASLKTQSSKLDELKRGTRPEEIRIKEIELENARQNLENYYTGVRDILNDAFAKADDAVRTKTDDLFTDDETQNPKLTFSTSNSQTELDVLALRVKAGGELTAWKTELNSLNLNATQEELNQAIQRGKSHLSIIRDFLARALDAVDVSTGLSSTYVSSYKLNIYTGRTNVITSFTTLSSQEQTIVSQKIAVEKIKSELDLKLAGSTSEEIKAQEAQVEQAEANLLYYRSQLNKTILRAPFAGTVTKVDVEVGDIANTTASAVSLIGSGKFEIDANIAESDIAKVKIGNVAKVTLDAYGKNVLFEAKIVQINLSETILEGVATYKTKLQFSENDERILPGLTANVDVLSNKKEGVLYIPTRNINTEEGKQYAVKLNADGSKQEVEIKTGLRGSDGRTEIISGLSEGDTVVVE